MGNYAIFDTSSFVPTADDLEDAVLEGVLELEDDLADAVLEGVLELEDELKDAVLEGVLELEDELKDTVLEGVLELENDLEDAAPVSCCTKIDHVADGQNSLPCRRPRAATIEQLIVLEEAFLKCPYPGKEERHSLADRTKLSTDFIMRWLINRRRRKLGRADRQPEHRRTNLYQRMMLENAFARSSSVEGDELRGLADSTGLPEANVKKWFKHRRQKLARAQKAKERRQFPSLLSDYKPAKRVFVKKTEEQIQQLNDYFSKNNYPGNQELIDIVRETGLDRRKVTSWFSEKRRLLQ